MGMMPKTLLIPKKRKFVLPSERILMRAYSERLSYKTCRQQWDWMFNQWLRLPEDSHAPALKFGTLIHIALAGYYKPGLKRGPHPIKGFEKAMDELAPDGFNMIADEEKYVDARELGVNMLENYVDKWGDDNHMKILMPECPFNVDLFDADGIYVVTVVGKIDAIFQDLNTKKIGLFEHKTAAAIDTTHLALDEQAGSYWAFASMYLADAGVLKPGRDISFILYNFLRKAKMDERPSNELGQRLNKNGSVSKKQPSPLFHRFPVYRGEADKNMLVNRVIVEAKEMAMVRSGQLEIYKNPRGAYPDVHCKSCPYKGMCELHETGSDWEEYRDAVMVKVDPNADYRDLDFDGARDEIL